jgi:hypothetical protein
VTAQPAASVQMAASDILNDLRERAMMRFPEGGDISSVSQKMPWRQILTGTIC